MEQIKKTNNSLHVMHEENIAFREENLTLRSKVKSLEANQINVEHMGRIEPTIHRMQTLESTPVGQTNKASNVQLTPSIDILEMPNPNSANHFTFCGSIQSSIPLIDLEGIVRPPLTKESTSAQDQDMKDANQVIPNPVTNVTPTETLPFIPTGGDKSLTYEEFIEQMVAKKLEDMEALINRIPRVPAPIKKSLRSSFADSPFVDSIALVEMPKKFVYPTIKMYNDTIDPNDHIASYK